MTVPVVSQPQQSLITSIILILAILIGIMMTNEVEKLFMLISQLHILLCHVLVHVFCPFFN